MIALPDKIRAMPVAKALEFSPKGHQFAEAFSVMGTWRLRPQGYTRALTGQYVASDAPEAAAQADHEAGLTAATNDLRGMLAEAIEALSKSAEAWMNALELDLIPDRHRATAQAMLDAERATLSRIAAQIGGAK